MSNSYAARLALRIREILPDDTEFVVNEGENDDWIGYLFAFHPNGAFAYFLPLAEDKRAAVTEDSVQVALRSIALKLFPHDKYTPKYRDRKREAHNAWVAQTGIELTV